MPTQDNEGTPNLKAARRGRRSALTRAINDVQRSIVEEDTEEVKVRLDVLKGKFNNFTSTHDEFHATLMDENEIDESEKYFYDAEREYTQTYREVKLWLKSLDVKQSVSTPLEDVENKPASVSTDNKSDLFSLINLPKVELECFDGNPMNYHAFFSVFDENVDNAISDGGAKLMRLLQYTKGKAKEAIRACAILGGERGYKQAREILQKRFGNDHLISEHIMNTLKLGHPIGSSIEFQQFADELLNGLTSLRSMRRLYEIDTQSCITDIAMRLQPHIRTRWKRYAMDVKRDKDRYPCFEEFVDFVYREAEEATDPVYGQWNVKTKSSESKSNYKKSFTSLSTGATAHVKRKQTCIICSEDHRLFWCPEFKSMKPTERLKIVKDNRLCENCLLSNHVVSDCKKDSVCSVPGCGKKHTKFIHIGHGQNSDIPSTKVKQVTANQIKVENSESLGVSVPVVPVQVNDNLIVHALLDSASTSTFCTKKLVEKLKIKGRVVNYTLNTLSKTEEHKSSEVVSLKLTTKDGNGCLKLHGVFVVDDIPFRHAAFDFDCYEHLKDLPLSKEVKSVDVLIGQDHAEALLPLETRMGKKGDPFAVRTLLGWSLNGSVLTRDTINRHIVTHFICAESLEKQIDNLWKMENEGLCQANLAWSQCDKKVIELWDDNVKLTDGHYELPIPWKLNAHVPNNLCVAESRLKSLLKSLRKRSMFELYEAEVQNLLSKGFAEKVPVINPGKYAKIWYLPHQAVINEKKPGKMRMVFDCASRYEGESLNDKCLQGPDLNNKLLYVLLRFRQHEYAFTADVEAMYYQVVVPVDDRDALRFLWVDSEGNFVHYRMTRHVFGGVWCASAATYALRRTIEDSDGFDPMVIDTVLHSFYVDDCLKSVESKEQVGLVVNGTRQILQYGGFRLNKFVGTDECVFEHVPVTDVAVDVIKVWPEAVSRALGVKWNVNDDKFCFDFEMPDLKQLSRRVILSTVSSSFDPLGFIGPVVIGGKIIFQDATRLKLSWDDNVPEEIQSKWHKWIQSLNGLSDVKVPRCVKPKDFNDSYLELHHFSDASERAYGTCSYLRCVNKSGEIRTSLLISKSKVAPIKCVSIPRLELQGAVLSAQIDSMLRKELELDIARSYFWVDSKIVLQYIYSETRRFHVYVANRIGMIRSLTDPIDWFHIPGNENPADLITRGCSPEELISSNWFHGPKFLSQYKNTWQLESDVGELLEGDSEVKAEFNVENLGPVSCVLTVDLHPLDRLIEYYSSWYQLRRAVGWWLRFLKRFQHGKTCDGNLTVAELEEAEILIVKHVQRQMYANEIKCLSHDKMIEKSSNIKDLAPFLDSNGVMCVGGRLQYSCVSDRKKHPYIIPHQHNVSVMIVRESHEVAHLGPEWTLSRLRSKYWVTKARSVTKRVCRDCVICKRLYGMPCVQKMANLPPERLEPNKPPFSFVGIDCFGPFLVKYGRAEIKRYGCLYTCLTTRAVHIEKLVSLDTDAFLNGFRRFCSRRGVPVKVWSDNGTNFQGGFAELQKGLKQMNTGQLSAYGIRNNFEWVFNPPNASHMGGIWERMIRVVRKVFAYITKDVRLTDDVLETLFCEAEAIINSRPITKVSDSVNDAAALTPNHLLLLHDGPAPPPGVFQQGDMYKRRWKYVQFLAAQFWKRWLKEYIPELQRRNKWVDCQRNVCEGDLILLVDENTPRSLWPLGVIESVKKGRDGLVRSVAVRTKSSTFVRPVTKIVLLEGSN